MPVSRLLDEVSVEELIDWQAYAIIEPFGYEMENFRMGAIAATVANVAPRGRHAKVLKPSDFYPASKRRVYMPAHLERELAKRRAARKEGKPNV